MKYRIIKETKEKTRTTKYYIEKYWKFLLWDGWNKVKRYCPIDGPYYAEFDSKKRACNFYDEMTEKTIIEIITR